MEKILQQKYTPFYLLPVAVAFLLLGPDFLRVSMYNDGVWYAAIARNLAQGYGTFWSPHLSETIFPSFHEHPPLLFGLQSLFFTVLGDSVLTEKSYNLFVFLISWWLVVRLWRFACHEAGPTVAQAETADLWFLPVTFWLLNEVTYIFYPNNLLEGTVAVFDMAAVLCLLRAAQPGLRRPDRTFIGLAALLILGAFLTKGPVGLFPLGFFFLYWLVFRDISFPQMVRRTLLLTAVTGAGLGLLLLWPAARHSLWQYFDSQVLASVSGERTTFHFRDSRLYIIWRLFVLLIPALVLTAGMGGWFYFREKQRAGAGFRRWSILFLAVGLSASVPLAVSPKQGFYYLLPAIPYFAVGLGLLIAEGMASLLRKIDTQQLLFRRIRLAAWGLVGVSALFALSHWGEVARRDRPVWHDVAQIAEAVPDQTTISVPPPRNYQAPLVGYLQRYHRISVDTARLDRSFLLVEQERDTLPPAGYRPLDLDMVYFRLYERQ